MRGVLKNIFGILAFYAKISLLKRRAENHLMSIKKTCMGRLTG
jgi:hypothetical protein